MGSGFISPRKDGWKRLPSWPKGQRHSLERKDRGCGGRGGRNVVPPPYRAAFSIEHAIEELKQNAGTKYDPEVVKIFIKLFEEGRLPL